ncbi:unnamed protein product (macronuclear) [Paramecium tetraurelia]|uniref:Ubiquitin carboxyl-terminal hydrolase n=1 Tax=Paramecium tetraurelia TaxID=5888 RepID=A0D4J0_PARTE|nr:uncharacterized protein GSPATT00013423001 [Paramecium tetraurelia]CAK77957.1 unnamed protein product [Paramecium tetraurelia]|eukprot:XP_001445354.1 hypothetical protein (macronuclear) [Paramecium tetraurelia strain d4-2]
MQSSQQLQKPLDNAILQQERRNGYSEFDIRQAWNASSGNMSLFQQLLQGMRNQSFIMNPINQQFNDDIQVAVAASLTLHQQYMPIGKVRQNYVPCGLLNVGNTCYFNSLLQTYYFIYDFVSSIVKCKFDHVNLSNIVDKRVVNSIELVKNLQSLFVLMIGSDRQFVDPKKVILSICDDFGKALPIGDQKDVSEFNNYFLSRIDEGITYLTQSLQKTSTSQSQQSIKQQLPGQSIVQFPTIHFPDSNTNSMISQKSLLIRQSSVIAENSMVFKLFYGKFSPQIIRKGQASKDCQQEMFNIIQIDVNSKSLFEGFDKYMNQAVEYKNEKDEYQQAIKQFWIQSAPQVLTFQIQRVEYSKEFGSFTKINSFFHFEKEIYIDRYLLSNQKLAKDIQTQNQQMRDRLKKIDQELATLTQFNGNIDIIQNLETTLQFLKLQNSNEKQHQFFVDSSDNKASIKSISEYHQHFIKKRDCLQKERKEIEQKISESYNSLKKQKYILQSILMHEGNPDAGHYYAYIYNLDDQKWYYFNDINVHEEVEQNVLKNAFGDQSNSKSAYLIQYVKEDNAKFAQNSMVKLKLFSTSEDTKKYLTDGYGLLLSKQQREFLNQDNEKLKQEVEQQQLMNKIEQIITKYQQYLEIANEKQRKYQQKQYPPFPVKPPYLENYSMYLKIKPDERLFKWTILDNAIIKIMPETGGLFSQPGLKEIVKTQILEELNKLGNNKVQHFPTAQEYQTSIEEYKSALKLQCMIQYLLDQYNNNNFIEALQALQKYMKLAKHTPQSSFFYTVAINLKHIFPLGIISKMMQNKSVTEADLKSLKLVIAFQMQEHFLYTEPKFWNGQLQNLIDIAIGTFGSNEKWTQEVLKPIIQNKKDTEMCSLLDAASQNIDEYIQNLQSIYLEQQFENNLEDFLLDNSMNILQRFFLTKGIQILFESIQKSPTILDKKVILKIVEDNPQNK